MTEAMHVETDVLVIGAGGAGMYAAIEAARAGAQVLLADRSLIGRGGATVMAQMTVAAALGEQTPDHWEYHLSDTLAAGRGLCDERLAALLCEDGPRRLREMDGWKVGWAREDGHIKQAQAPGHDRPRCAYVDFLSTGPAVSRTLRSQLNAANGVRRIGELVIVDIAIRDGEACGATALHLPTGQVVTLAAKAVVIAAVTFAVGLVSAAIVVTLGQQVLRDHGVYVWPATALTQLRVIVGTAAVLAVAAVIALALGALLRRSAITVAVVIVVLVLPYLLTVTVPLLPTGPTDWLARVTPAAAFAVEQTLVQYPQVNDVYTPSVGYWPLAPWAGLAVLCAWAALVLRLAVYRLNRTDA